MNTKPIIRNLTIAIVAFLALDFALGEIAVYGIRKFYGLNQHSDMLLIGHSQLMLATDKEQMEADLGLKISKFCREGADVNDRYIMSKMFLDSPYSDSLKYVVYGVDLYTFTNGNLSINSHKAFYPFVYDSNIEAYIRQHTGLTDFYLTKYISTYRFNDDITKNASLRGLRSDWSNKNGVIDIEAYKKQLQDKSEFKIQMNPDLMKTFDNTVRLFTAKGVKVILVNTPTLDLLNANQPDKFKEITEWYETYARQNPMVEYWNFNQDYSSSHELFFDRIHVNVEGQKKVSAAMTRKFIETYLKAQTNLNR
ncbi:MAG: SGNH/GDSL hydrolase family protein [Bacteroidales bacterium]|nr:SGNH/GDSL hydrolase family protein [Bacteroidales bacterium]